jgi:hypothetical protein
VSAKDLHGDIHPRSYAALEAENIRLREALEMAARALETAGTVDVVYQQGCLIHAEKARAALSRNEDADILPSGETQVGPSISVPPGPSLTTPPNEASTTQASPVIPRKAGGRLKGDGQ